MSEQRDVVERLEEAGSVGLDLSPGDPLCAEAAAEIRRLRSMLKGAVEGFVTAQYVVNGETVTTFTSHGGFPDDVPALLLLLPRDTEAE